MAKVIILEIAGCALSLLGLLLCLVHPSGLPLAACMAAAAAVMAAAAGFSYQQLRIQKHLIQACREKKKEKTVEWEEDAHQLQLMQKRVELSILQNQINPHFLYNTLDGIRSKALIDGQKEIARMTEILSRFFRYCIGNQDNLVRVREELNHIEDYYYIQKFRFQERFDMEVELEDDEIYDLYIPRMTLQPIVENAMIHGLEESEEKGRIFVRLMRSLRDLVIVISDNGVGMSQEKLFWLNDRMSQPYLKTGSSQGSGNGIALSNVNTRLKLTFGEEYGIHYRSLEGEGTDAVVVLPAVDIFSRVRYEEET